MIWYNQSESIIIIWHSIRTTKSDFQDLGQKAWFAQAHIKHKRPLKNDAFLEILWPSETLKLLVLPRWFYKPLPLVAWRHLLMLPKEVFVYRFSRMHKFFFFDTVKMQRINSESKCNHKAKAKIELSVCAETVFHAVL